MKIYRVTFTTVDGISDGYEFFSNKKDADKRQVKANEETNSTDKVHTLNVILTKKGITDLLNVWASHNDNG